MLIEGQARSSRRWVVVVLVGWVLFSVGRFSLPVAIVDMQRELNWDNRTSALILSSFYWGYMVTPVIGDQLSERYGGDQVQWVAGVVWSLATFTVGYVAHVSGIMVAVAHLVSGLAQGLHYAGVISAIAQRQLQAEKDSFFLPRNALGANGILFLGAILIGNLGALHLFRWHHVFLTLSLLGLLWAFFQRSVALNSTPKMYYKFPGGGRERGGGLKLDVRPVIGDCSRLPWKMILTQPSILALLFAYFCYSFSASNVQSWAPSFHTVSSLENGHNMTWMYTTIPWYLMMTGILVGGVFSCPDQWAIGVLSISTAAARKSTVALLIGGGVLLLWAAESSAFAKLSLALVLLGASTAGLVLNIADLTPNYATTMLAVITSVGALAGALSVYLTGCILQSTSSWSPVFHLMAGASMAGGVTFLLFGSTKKLQVENYHYHLLMTAA